MALSHLGLVNTVISMRGAGYSWGKIRKRIAPDVPKIVFYKIAHTSYEPKDPILRYKLGLPMMKEVAICDECGRIKSPYHKCDSSSRPPRIAIRLTNPKSAATTILEHMDPNNISMLIELLEEKIV